MIKRFHANQARLKRHSRIRNHLEGSQARPRLSVFRSDNNIYAQIIDDTTGRTLVSASSLEDTLQNYKPQDTSSLQVRLGAVVDRAPEVVETATEVVPTTGKGAKKAPKAPTKGQQQQQKGRPPTQVKTVLPTAQKGSARTPVEALAGIANNRKVVIAHEVGKLIGQRARETGIDRVVFDRGGYAYHGRIAALAEGAREAGLDF